MNSVSTTEYKTESNNILFKLPNIPKFDATTIDLMASLTSGFFTGVLTNPMDVVTARIMTQKSDLTKKMLNGFRPAISAPYKGILDCATRMAKEEGPKAFLKGIQTRILWITPFIAIQLGLNSCFKNKIEEYHQTNKPPLLIDNILLSCKLS